MYLHWQNACCLVFLRSHTGDLLHIGLNVRRRSGFYRYATVVNICSGGRDVVNYNIITAIRRLHYYVCVCVCVSLIRTVSECHKYTTYGMVNMTTNGTFCMRASVYIYIFAVGHL